MKQGVQRLLLQTDVASTLYTLLRRVGLCWQAPRAPQQASGIGDAVVRGGIALLALCCWPKRKMPGARGQSPRSLSVTPVGSAQGRDEANLRAELGMKDLQAQEDKLRLVGTAGLGVHAVKHNLGASDLEAKGLGEGAVVGDAGEDQGDDFRFPGRQSELAGEGIELFAGEFHGTGSGDACVARTRYPSVPLMRRLRERAGYE